MTRGLRALAAECAVDVATLRRAAEAKVLADLGYARVAAPEDGTWRDLIGAAAVEPRDDGADAARHLARFDATRVAGYLDEALRQMVAHPDAAHRERTLLRDDEVAWQLRELRGPRAPLGDALFVERFERQARLLPDAVAAVHRDRRWTYSELDARANGIARQVLRAGAAPEDVVAVATGRHLAWVAAILGVLKAGAAYLPVRPDFPPDWIAAQLERSRCAVTVADPDGASALRRARWAGTVLRSDAPAAAESPGIAPPADALAYVYFTSGSTGAPKGAMCEHAGMLNHLLMKVEDMRIGRGDVVTQTASQCFDISLWQVAAPLLVGAGTLVVDTEAQLDVDGFLDRIAAGGIHVAQVVPSYLDVAIAHLERRPRALGDLRRVSVTGEALKHELVRRWFAQQPDVPLVNAYGATEVSDDTMHAVLEAAPAALVSLGRPLRNVDAYVLDERLRLAPFGAPGEIAFSGVCVGRGYVNDSDRTAEAFVADPYRPGARMYRTGDFGRWLADGTIEFLGRRDQQVKISGFRIEIGEIENTLLRMPGVRECAAVTDGGSSETRRLVAFFTGPETLQAADLRDFLLAALPDYMVPAVFHRLPALPLNENGKVDKRALAALAEGMRGSAPDFVPPVTETERRLATAWAETLDVLVGRIGRGDDFFRLGGTSLAAVRLIVRLDRAISLRELVANPVLSDLAAALDGRSAADDGPLLQPLSSVNGDPSATLVCFPYASGNAVNFAALARALEPDGIAAYGVELPGHDVARPDEPVAGVEEVVERVEAELRDRARGPVLVWGHCAGAVHAVALARRLEDSGRGPARVFAAAMTPVDAESLEREVEALSASSEAAIADELRRSSAYVELDLLQAERAELTGRAYRHDVCSTNRHLISQLRDGAAPRLRAPLEVVVAADDPSTTTDGGGWDRIAARADVHVLGGGGHYFVRTRPEEVAALVRARCGVRA